MDPIPLDQDTDDPIAPARLQHLARGSLKAFCSGLSVDDDGSSALHIWRGLLYTALNPSVKEKYLTSACNALCVFLDCATSSASIEVRNFSFSNSAWFNAFDVARRAFRDGKTKPALQVLEMLMKVLERNPDSELVHSIHHRAIGAILKILLFSGLPNELKESCIFLTCFMKAGLTLELLFALTSRTIEFHQRLWLEKLQKHKIQLGQLLKTNPGSYPLLLVLVLAARLSEPQSAAIKLLSRLCSRGLKSDDVTQSPITTANRVIRDVMASDEGAVQDLTQTLFPVLLADHDLYVEVLQDYSTTVSSTNDILALLAILRVGRLNNFVTEEGLSPYAARLFLVCDESDGGAPTQYSFLSCLTYNTAEVRIRTFELLISSSQTSEAISHSPLTCMVLGLPYLCDDTDPYDRGEILSLSRRLFRRLQNSSSMLEKKVSYNETDQQSRSTLASYRRFGDGLLKFLKGELGPHISYQRHILALQILSLALDLPMSADCIGRAAAHDLAIARSLIALTIDAFEDVRDTATRLLLLLSNRKPNKLIDVFDDFDIVFEVQKLSASTNRADHADAAGRLIAIYRALDASQRPVAARRMVLPVTKAIHTLDMHLKRTGSLVPSNGFPLHAYLLAIVHILHYPPGNTHPPDSNLFSNIVSTCKHVWHLVRPQLCVDSPETAQDVTAGSFARGPKDMLAYSWRALRDSSLVLQRLLERGSCSPEQLQTIGDVCMEQLTHLRHRGAFSTVAQTFVLCCQYGRSTPNCKNSEMLKKWYQTAVAQIDEQSERLTRRSAGLPAMLTALLDPDDSQAMSIAINDLVQESEASMDQGVSSNEQEGQRLPQVHALNCLKEFMTHSRFRIASEEHFNLIIQLASRCLNSKIWAVQNCGLMLLSACINRLDSVTISESQADSLKELLVSRIETPFSIGVKLLDEASQSTLLVSQTGKSSCDSATTSSSTERIFAALDLLSRLHSRIRVPEFVGDLIERQLGNEVWAIREQAALLIAEEVQPGNEIHKADRLLEDVDSYPDNALHGRLLCTRNILKNTYWTGDQDSLVAVTTWLRQTFSVMHLRLAKRSPLVRGAAIDIENDHLNALQPNPNLTTNARGSEYEAIHTPMPYRGDVFLLTGSLALNHILRRLSIPSTSATFSQEDANEIAEYYSDEDIIEKIVEQLSTEPIPLRASILLLLAFLKRVESGTTLAHILSSLSICLGRSAHSLSEDQITYLDQRLLSIEPLSRELWLGRIKLGASLMYQCLVQRQARSLLGDAGGLQEKSFGGFVAQLVEDIRSAAHDEIDLPTRETATNAIALVVPAIQQTKKAMPVSVRISLCLTLYDLLNDDDVDIRSCAASTTSSLLLETKSSPVLAAGRWSPLCAREKLVHYLCVQYRNESTFAIAALEKIAGPSIMGQAKDVGEEIKEIRNAAISLFMEEKQNLYVDEVQVIASWLTAKQSIVISLPKSNWPVLASWITKGIEALSRELESFLLPEENKPGLWRVHRQAHCFGPFGATYHLDVLVVFLRVIHSAELLIAYYRSARSQQPEAVRDLEQQLHALHDLSVQCQAHELITQALGGVLIDRRTDQTQLTL